MNYYDEVLIELQKLIKDKKYEEAQAIIINELKMPYIPKEFENSLNEYNKLLNGFKKYSFKEDEFDLIEYLNADEIKQLAAVEYISKQRISDYYQEIKDYLNGDGFIKAKELLIFELIEKGIDINIDYKKEDEIYTFNPKNTEPLTTSKFYKGIIKLLDEYFLKNPDFNHLSKEVLIAMMFDHLPLTYIEDDIQLVFNSIVVYIYKIFNLDEELRIFEEKLVKNNQKNQKLIKINIL